MAENLPRVLQQLVVLRNQQGRSQRGIAVDLGTQQSAISEMERNEVSPTLALLSRYAALFGMEVALTPRLPEVEKHG